jgi:predicted ATP-dependent endonuclease of OLD family
MIGDRAVTPFGMLLMKLVWFEMTGYKRFAKHTKVNLSEKCVAIVGPNEAGKTTLLKCLLHFNHRNPFIATGGSQELTRGVNAGDDETIAEWTFAIDAGDRDILNEIPEAKDARWYAIKKRKNGKALFTLTPNLKRSREPRKAARSQLEAAINRKPATDSIEDAEAVSQLRPELQDLAAQLRSDAETLPKEMLDKIASLVAALVNTSLESVGKFLSDLHVHESLPPPTDRAGAILEKRKPTFLFFDSDDRDLRSEYDIQKYFRKDDPNRNIRRETIPTALVNLANAATLDLETLYTAQANDDRGQVRTILEKAEDTLTALVRDSWTQSELSLSLELDGFRLQILLRSQEGQYVKVVERSDGLRQFVALLFFLARQPKSECKPILLIDEAESRLHYDAQADLVQVLAKQQLAAKVIYTTHSIGYLPEDLGSGVRMVAADDPYSTVENCFWDSKRPGFSPLLFSMGAQTLAFLPMRYAVIAEGIADLILVPAVLKAALELESLGFQVVPGLSSGSSDEIAILDN